jgi:PAS domain S-box-containing protein
MSLLGRTIGALAFATRPPESFCCRLAWGLLITVGSLLLSFLLSWWLLSQGPTWGASVPLLGGLLTAALLAVYFGCLFGHTADVKRRVAEQTQELRDSAERFRRLIDNVSDALFLCDHPGGKILEVNRQSCDSLGYTREELLGMRIVDIDVDFVAKKLARYLTLPDDEYPVTLETVHRRKDGTIFPVEIRVAPLHTGGQRLVLGVVRDITERKRVEATLRNDRQLLRAMLDLHERDRKLVAYEIHDGLAQQLTGALMKFQSIEPLRGQDPEAARKTFDEATALLREGLAETRRLIGGLRPAALDESGVVAAIDYLIAERRQRSGLEIEFVHPETFQRLASPLESAIFRVVQECLTNACRHSRSTKVRIELWQSGDRAGVEVRDWGVGFDPSHVGVGHFGLQGICERARLLGGVASIKSVVGGGTDIRVEFPLVPPIENGAANNPDNGAA